MKIEFKKYNLKTDPNEKQIGVIAQQLEQIFPSLVNTNKDEYKVSKIFNIKYYWIIINSKINKRS